MICMTFVYKLVHSLQKIKTTKKTFRSLKSRNCLFSVVYHCCSSSQTEATAIFCLYFSQTVAADLKSAEFEKETKYVEASEVRHACFTPLVFSADDLPGNELKEFMRVLTHQLSDKRHEPRSKIAWCVRVRIWQ